MEHCGLQPVACWIQGEERWGQQSTPLINPSTGEEYARVTVADPALVQAALSSAREGFALWRKVPVPERSAILHALAGRIRENRDALASLVCTEVGKPFRAACDEVLSAASLIDYFAEESLRLTGQIPLLGYRREQVTVVREPVGVVAAITPFNYPLSTLACKMPAALAVGCALVAKPDEHTPLSTLKLARLAAEAGLPPGVFNVVTGPGHETGRSLVDSPIPRLITFTGSTQVGKEIQAVSAKWARKVVLELGGHCPALVCEDAPWRDVLPQIVTQSLKNCGQYCYRISRIFVAEAIYEEFLREFVRAVSALRMGLASEPETDLGPLNNPDVFATVCRQVEAAIRQGARVELGGTSGAASCDGFYYPPTILSIDEPEKTVLHEEIFGPVVIVSPFRDIETAIERANATPYGLAAYLFTRNLGGALEWAARLEVGSVWINRIHQAYLEVPFGGMKESGLGREKSRFGLEEYTELKTVYLSY